MRIFLRLHILSCPSVNTRTFGEHTALNYDLAVKFKVSICIQNVSETNCNSSATTSSETPNLLQQLMRLSSKIVQNFRCTVLWAVVDAMAETE